MYLIIILATAGFSMWVSSTLKRKFKKYSRELLQSGMSGKEIAEQMLIDHGIRDVKVVSTSGMLSDHYNPKTKTVNLKISHLKNNIDYFPGNNNYLFR